MSCTVWLFYWLFSFHFTFSNSNLYQMFYKCWRQEMLILKYAVGNICNSIFITMYICMYFKFESEFHGEILLHVLIKYYVGGKQSVHVLWGIGKWRIEKIWINYINLQLVFHAMLNG